MLRLKATQDTVVSLNQSRTVTTPKLLWRAQDIRVSTCPAVAFLTSETCGVRGVGGGYDSSQLSECRLIDLVLGK